MFHDLLRPATFAAVLSTAVFAQVTDARAQTAQP